MLQYQNVGNGAVYFALFTFSSPLKCGVEKVKIGQADGYRYNVSLVAVTDFGVSSDSPNAIIIMMNNSPLE